ncbi:MAG: hypothetical protein J3Q66DRAFT_24497 [Benniella sp.]|nr:MAG: hypothetical protein J3Q66DRAFT_24497 [Benniella sp.]
MRQQSRSATMCKGVTGEELFIVAMTACVMPGDREKCIAIGMNQYLSKPIRKEELCAMLEQWLDERAKTGKQLKVQSQRKLIQRKKKKREMVRKRTLASLLVSMTGFAEESTEVSSTGVDPDDDGDDDDDDDREER